MRRRHLLFLLGAFISAPAFASEPKKKGGGAGYTQFPTMTVFTEASKRKHGTLSVDMGLYSEDEKLVELIKLNQPRLQDAYLSRLQAYAGTLNARSLADIGFITTQLQSATDAILARKDAKVLLGSVMLN
ncbi:hypothetical protein [Asticcacaulis benevestitus]|uniref:Tat pathway signal protein n=1 Tax=Asticcacaulis benevestitus DSM 16100 = ATCC BAA-896 TaxID=1121022 RepID=V4Q045_9CAUL|nr:hypothetical protein [Asticcacaulis benevestitus]ESQ94021.1 hypothetical protein ABENE_02735 [Asticcacaulis benevestitus DSM 16100 = ATCC BAA-896]